MEVIFTLILVTALAITAVYTCYTRNYCTVYEGCIELTSLANDMSTDEPCELTALGGEFGESS